MSLRWTQPGTRQFRVLKAVAYLASGGAGFAMVFETDYGDHEHVFSGAQRWYRAQKARLFQVDQREVALLTQPPPPPPHEPGVGDHRPEGS